MTKDLVSPAPLSAEVKNRIRGTLFGQAIGDALGLGTEFMTREEVCVHYPDGLHDYEQIIQDRHRRRWRRGNWTDDTDQMICILDSILKLKRVDPEDIALYLHRWMVQGGMGIGFTVQAVMKHNDFLFTPHQCACEIWESTGRLAAANGGVMRTSVLGVFDFHDPAKVRQNAEAACKVTHYDPRCVASCVGVSHAISALLRGKDHLEKILEDVGRITLPYDARIQEYYDIALHGSLEDLHLDDEDTMGYTLKAFGAAFWALKHASSFEEGVLSVIHQGGDADTNAAVAGALLGARFGFSEIPEPWIFGLNGRHLLGELIDNLIHLIET